MITITTILNRLGIATTNQLTEFKASAEAEANRAYEAGFFDGFHDGEDEPPQGDIKKYGYQKTSAGKRDFTQLTQDQINTTVWSLFQTNGTASRALSLKRDHILGENEPPMADGDDILQEIIDEFWRINKMTFRLDDFIFAWSLFGELCLPVFVRQTDGRIKLGYIDPSEIEEEGIITHPHNVLEQWAVVTKIKGGRQRVYRIIREDEGFVSQDRVFPPNHPGLMVTAHQAALEPWELLFLQSYNLSHYSGSCFYFDKNNVPGQLRGFSDLLQSADDLDLQAETLFNLGELQALAAYFGWDVSAKNADPKQVKERSAEIRRNPPTKRGQINYHNDGEIWELKTPDLKQSGTIEAADALKKQALQGLNQPGFWHGDEDTANRSTAEEASSPTNVSLQKEQNRAKGIIWNLAAFARDQAQIAGLWRPTTEAAPDGTVIEHDGSITVTLPEIVKRKFEKLGPLFVQMVQGLTVAMLDLKVITRETTSITVSKILAEFGVEYDPIAEIAKVDEEESKAAMGTADAAGQFLDGLMSREDGENGQVGP